MSDNDSAKPSKRVSSPTKSNSNHHNHDNGQQQEQQHDDSRQSSTSPTQSPSLSSSYRTPPSKRNHHHSKNGTTPSSSSRLKKKGGRLSYGTPVGPRTPSSPAVAGPIRTLYLIRHGESLGQRASRKERKTNERLVDCGLTQHGIEQAKHIPHLLKDIDDIQLIVTSPLTRAIHTTLLAFPTRTMSAPPQTCINEATAPDMDVAEKHVTDADDTDTKAMDNNMNNNNNIPIWVGYDLREIGSSIPENRPRKFKEIWKDLNVDPITRQRFDLLTLKQDDYGHAWPKGCDTPPHVVRKDRVRNVFTALAAPDGPLPPHITTLAVVCHFNVIRTALSDPHCAGQHPISPVNAQPIECRLHPNGFVEYARVLEDS